MSNNQNAGVLIAVGAVFLAAVITTVSVAEASRNSSGTMSAANGPYISGTTISSTAVNARFSDIENEITDSLSRSGKGSMTAPLKEADGTVAAPSFSFTTEPGSGLYRIGAGDFGFSVGGVKKHEWTATGETVVGTYTQTVSGSASTVAALVLQPSLTNGNVATLEVGRSNTSNDAAQFVFIPNATAALSTGCLTLAGQPVALCVDGNQKTTAAGALAVTGASTLTGGAIIGSSGTAISKSVRGTVVWNPGTLTTNTAATNTITVTGAVAGADCIAGVIDPATVNGYPVQCIITADTCTIALRNQQSVSFTFGSATFYCRAFNL